MVLGFAWAAEFFGGVAAITGAFIAGVALSSTPGKEKIHRGIHTLTYAFFVPVFLVSIGLTMDARALSPADLGFVSVLCVIALISKALGAGLGASWGGLNRVSALRVGLGMVSRGEVGLIVAQVGKSAGLLTNAGFTAIVVMVLVTTLLTPPLLRWAFRLPEAKHG
jgi:Kef-type K+ transport system membrane component KefB